jgi:hypothetical protein
MDEIIEKVLIDYVEEFHLDRNAEYLIYDFCSKQLPLTTTVYRGHDKTPIIKNNMWYSASFNMDVAGNDFSGKDCCIFIIHLVNVPCIIINNFIGDKIKNKTEEEEVIFLGGGDFYRNSELSEKGFVDLGKKNKYNKQMFESWYSDFKSEFKGQEKYEDDNNNKDIVKRLLNIIDPEEYDFISTPDDILSNELNLTQQQKEDIFKEIKKRKDDKNNILKGGQTKKRKTKKGKTKKGKTKKGKTKKRKIKKFKLF